MQQHFILREHKLIWELPSVKTCRICFNTSHSTLMCTSKNKKAHQYERLNKLYEKRDISYRKPIITSPTLNYKKALLSNNSPTSSTSRPWNSNNLQNPQINDISNFQQIPIPISQNKTATQTYTQEILNLKQDMNNFSKKLHSLEK